jgi:hypothetical protein
LALPFAHFIVIKEGIMRESVRLGSVTKALVYKMFKIDQTVIEPIFDFLVNQEEIIVDEDA